MSMLDSSKLWRPFSKPVMDAQQAFRSIMKAMSEPGTLFDLGRIYGDEKASSVGRLRRPEQVAAFVIALTLMDQDTSVWISPAFAERHMATNLSFHCGSQCAESSSDSDFAILMLAEWQDIKPFRSGSEEKPHLSTTLIIEVPALRAEGEPHLPGESQLVLEGPGIASRRELGVLGLTPAQCELLRSNQSQFPRGLDILLTCRDQVVALSRSTRIVSWNCPQEVSSCMSQ